MNNFLKQTTNFLFNKETTLVSSVNLLLILNLLLHKNKNHIILHFVIMLIYFIFSKRKDKLIIFCVYILFSLLSFFAESHIIKITNKETLQYNSPYKINNVPFWLFSAYLGMVINIFLFYDYFKMIL